jgi:hypothetical protein
MSAVFGFCPVLIFNMIGLFVQIRQHIHSEPVKFCGAESNFRLIVWFAADCEEC